MLRFLMISVLMMAGCMTTTADRIKSVMDQYENINLDDGVTLEEAKVIAQRSLIKENMVKFYDLENPKLAKEVADLPRQEDYWFITFKEKNVANIEFIFMVVIEKQNGRVRFADDYQEDKRWILEAALLGVQAVQ